MAEVKEKHRGRVLGCYGGLAMSERLFRFLKIGDNDLFLANVAQRFADDEAVIEGLRAELKLAMQVIEAADNLRAPQVSGIGLVNAQEGYDAARAALAKALKGNP